MAKKITFIIDFDSTFVRLEALDELAQIALNHHDDKEKVIEEIRAITAKGMEGEIPFEESLFRRIKMFRAHKNHLNLLVKKLKVNITPSILKNKTFFQNNKDNIYIVSGGFKEYILPVVKDFYLKENHIFSNSLFFDWRGYVVDYDKNHPLCKSDGKAEVVKRQNFSGEIYAIGDGYTDYQIKKSGIATKFFAFVENVKRESVVKKADYVAASFDEIIARI
jgi:D-3-phosphoglycerate dehydrogenase